MENTHHHHPTGLPPIYMQLFLFLFFYFGVETREIFSFPPPPYIVIVEYFVFHLCLYLWLPFNQLEHPVDAYERETDRCN